MLPLFSVWSAIDSSAKCMGPTILVVVEDCATAFTAEFCERLAQGDAPSFAFGAAVRALKQKRRSASTRLVPPDHPIYWAPMMFCLLQTCRAARGRPTGGRTRPQAGFAFARFPLSQCNLRNGPEPSRARGLCAAKRTLDGEDRSGTWGRRESGPGVSGGVPLAGIRGSAPRTLPRAFSARGIKHPVRHISSLRQYEVRKIREYPLVLQRSIDDPQEFARQGDNRLSRPAPRRALIFS